MVTIKKFALEENKTLYYYNNQEKSDMKKKVGNYKKLSSIKKMKNSY